MRRKQKGYERADEIAIVFRLCALGIRILELATMQPLKLPTCSRLSLVANESKDDSIPPHGLPLLAKFPEETRSSEKCPANRSGHKQ